MLKTRVLTGTILSVIIAIVLVFSYIPWMLDIAIAALCVQAIYELYNAMGFKNHKWLYWISYAVALVISFVALPNYEYIVAPLFVLAIVIFAIWHLSSALRKP